MNTNSFEIMIIIGASTTTAQLSGWIIMMIVIVFVMVKRTVYTGWCAEQMVIANISIKCYDIISNLVILPWTSRTTVCRTDCTGWWGERTSFIMFWYWNFQWCIYHIGIFHGFCCFRWHFKRMIYVALE